MGNLSITMASALAEMQRHGGELECWKGGFWTYPGCAVKSTERGATGEYKVPAWYVGTQTLRALKDRGCVEFTERLQPSGYPVRARIAKATGETV